MEIVTYNVPNSATLTTLKGVCAALKIKFAKGCLSDENTLYSTLGLKVKLILGCLKDEKVIYILFGRLAIVFKHPLVLSTFPSS
jgi:hypothetical protein